MTINVYYKDANKKLRQIAADSDNHVEVLEAVKKQLEIEKEVATSPILALLQGGKKPAPIDYSLNGKDAA